MATRIGNRPITAPAWTGQPRTDLALIDCDVHQIIRSQDDLYPYLPRLYREQVQDQGMLPAAGYFNGARRAGRTDLNTGCDADTNFAEHNIHSLGAEYELLREAHLDFWNVDALGRAQHYRVIGNYFASSAEEAIARNAQRPPSQRVPDTAIWGTHRKLQILTFAEGFDELWYVHTHDGSFEVEAWRNAL